MAKSTNWVKMNRSIFNNFLWTDKEPFCKRAAWMDLILLANHEDGEILSNKGNLIKIPRGAHFTSIRTLATRWRWSENKVRRFLDILSGAGMVTVSGTPSGTLLTLVKYDDYQGERHNHEYNHEYNREYDVEYNHEYNVGIQTRIEEENKNDKEGEEALSSSVDCPWWHDDYDAGNDDDEDDYWKGVTDDYDERRSEESVSDGGRKLDVPPRTFNYADKVRKLIYGIERLSDPRGGTGDSECD